MSQFGVVFVVSATNPDGWTGVQASVIEITKERGEQRLRDAFKLFRGDKLTIIRKDVGARELEDGSVIVAQDPFTDEDVEHRWKASMRFSIKDEPGEIMQAERFDEGAPAMLGLGEV